MNYVNFIMKPSFQTDIENNEFGFVIETEDGDHEATVSETADVGIKISLDFAGIPVLELIRYVCQMSGL